MQSDKFTAIVRNAIGEAQTAALSANHQKLVGEHILAALLKDDNTAVKMLLNKAGGDVGAISKAVAAELAKLPQITGSGAGQLQIDADLARLFGAAEKESKSRHDQYIAADVLLLVMAKSKSSVGQILVDAGVNAATLEVAIADLRKGRSADSDGAEDSYDALSRYTADLTENARNGKLDPVVGRDAEVRRSIQILARRTKNNPVLIGQPGVGKTAIAEGLAQRIINGDVPEALANKTLLSLDMGALVAGAKYRGDRRTAESRFERSARADGEIILY